jgi:predicted aldo/keto reductase-like oxidoreductase
MLAYNPSNLEVEGEVLPLCHRMGIGTVIMKPLGGGILSEARSAQLGFSVTAEECLRFAATGQGVDVVIPGLDKPEYVRTAADIGDHAEMAQKEREALIARVDIKAKHYCRGCGYCLPCPQGIPIPTVLGLYNRWEVLAAWTGRRCTRSPTNTPARLTRPMDPPNASPAANAPPAAPSTSRSGIDGESW